MGGCFCSGAVLHLLVAGQSQAFQLRRLYRGEDRRLRQMRRRRVGEADQLLPLQGVEANRGIGGGGEKEYAGWGKKGGG